MWIPPFNLHQPKTLKEAAKLAAGFGERFDFLAGGTDLLQNYKCRINVQPDVISLRHIPELARRDGEIFGAGQLLGDMVRDAQLAAEIPALHDTANQVASPLIINTATLGGNLLQDTRCYHFNQSYWWRMAHNSCLKAEADICRVVPEPGNICYATYQGDLAPLLIVMNSSVLLASSEGEREVPLKSFFEMDGIKRFVKKKQEILAGVRVPVKGKKARFGYRKLRVRKSIDYPEAGVAAALELDGDRVKGLRLAATAVAPVPMLFDEHLGPLIGQKFNEEWIEEVGATVVKHSVAYRNTYLVPGYRRKMLGVLTRRLLRALADPAGQKRGKKPVPV